MLSLCLNLKGGQLSQWQNYDFNSMAKIGGQYVGAGESGLFTLDSGDFDSGMPIEAFFELATSDWGIPNQKRIRTLYFGYESDGNLMVTVRDDDGNERFFTLAPNHSANLQHSAKVPGARDGKGRYWMIRVDNVNGSDFSVDSIHVLPIVLNRRPAAA
ncbi:MAG: hypothetical protein V2I40_12080 [Desulfobacteraceae bacterium]|jgi:hypothetical protein|nr:hypothetical protein [Desulfobacteraceae bacterium]